MRHSDCVSRHCSRCGRELVDAASRECGVGPVCRKKNNDIFSRQIVSKLTIATAQILDFDSTDFHNEIADEFPKVRQKFLKKVERLRQETNNPNIHMLPGADFRFLADWLDRSLSYPIRNNTRNKTIDLIESLGYVALASVLRGEACMSPAKLYIEGNTIFLNGKSNKAGFVALRRALGRSVKTPRYRGDKTPYSTHVSNAETFVKFAIKHWPFMKDVDIDTLLDEATKLAANCEPVDNRTEILLYKNMSNEIVAKLPWTGTREQMINVIEKFKNIPFKDRKYNQTTKSWSFHPRHEEKIKEIIKNSDLFKLTDV
jgi:hypothetical protein